MVKNIVVLGAGVSGLTSALLLAKDTNNSVTVIAKHMPGDYDIEYTSPWAGANFMPYVGCVSHGTMFVRVNMLTDDAQHYVKSPESAGALEVQEADSTCARAEVRIWRRKKDMATGNAYDGLFAEDPWFRHLFDDYRDLKPEELPAAAHSGSEFGSVCLNTALYLPWLVGQCRRHGVVVKRAVLSHIHEAKAMHHSGQLADCIVNASGLLACRLGGVEDATVIPARGQIVLVRNEATPMSTISGTEDVATDVSYLMQRASGGGTILGGTYEKGNWEANPDPNTAIRIMKRCVELNPTLTNGKGIEALDIVRHGVGLRPTRKDGVRLETDTSIFEDGTPVVHNYGHAGWGYQGSYGCAERVVELVNELGQASKAKL
ncbi:D-amino-acid oxidase [Verticillium dahliae VdLs.17]|uniref:D-amino-acid oxidase n=2 Tax=Verticillium TaxID=1036719 RepID=G2XID3_VERDV|nr:D-amino-acid oxidase [Verticillium dahliae VdLs.17]EGY19581.1 D-amino-acid oxidase [Verticillium dahliae VdLs.17]